MAPLALIDNLTAAAEEQDEREENGCQIDKEIATVLRANVIRIVITREIIRCRRRERSTSRNKKRKLGIFYTPPSGKSLKNS